MNSRTAIMCCILIALGPATAGFLVGTNIYHSRLDANYVTVKGLAERAVKADLAVWNLTFSATGDDLTQVNNEINHDQALVLAFLKKNGVDVSEITIQPTKVIDRFANQYQTAKPPHRFLIQGKIKVRSNNVDHIQQISQLTSSLIQQGVVLNSSDDPSIINPIYFYTQLNSIRPAMLAEATKSARAVAEQFVLDSGSQLGAIHHANQGVFEITSQDASGESNPNDWQAAQNEKASVSKEVRLVTTIEYALKGK